MREGLGSPDLDSRPGGTLPLALHRALGAPGAAGHGRRPRVRPRRARARLRAGRRHADRRPAHPQGRAPPRRQARGGHEPPVVAGSPTRPRASASRPAAARPSCWRCRPRFDLGRRSEAERLAQAAGVEFDALRALVRALQAGEDVVVLYGERLVSGPRAAPGGPRAARPGRAPEPARRPRGRGPAVRARVAQRARPGRGGRAAQRRPRALGDRGRPRRRRHRRRRPRGELTALYLLHADPVTELPGRAGWEAALERATTVIAHANFLTDGVREHATVVFPAESYAEKDGTLTHPDGRVQRLRAAIGHPGDVRAEWSVLADAGPARGPRPRHPHRADGDRPARRGGALLRRADARRDRRPGRALAGPRRRRRLPGRRARARPPRRRAQEPPPAPAPNGRLRLGTFRSIWNATEVRVSPALHFLHPDLRVEMAPADAQRLELFQGDHVVVGSDGQRGRRDRHRARGHAGGQRLPGDQRARRPAGGGRARHEPACPSPRSATTSRGGCRSSRRS